MSNVQKVTVRFNMDSEQDRRAYSILMLEREESRCSISRTIMEALDGYYSRKHQLQDDPYLETREKEDAFLGRIENVVHESIRSSVFAFLPLAAQGTVTVPNNNSSIDSNKEDDDLDAALEWADTL